MKENKIIEGKYCDPNVLRNQNIMAKNNIVWSADITHLKLNGEEKLEKEKCLNQQSNSLIFENRDEFIELLSYGAHVEGQISYEREIKEYYSLISRYIEKVVIPSVFQWEFLKMREEDSNAATMITNDFKQLAVFSVDLRALKFSSLTTKISDVSRLAW